MLGLIKAFYVLSLTSPVDGLVHCNEKVGARIVQESNNTVVNITGNQPEDWQSQTGHGQLSGRFSIVEGEPFTVTLWAGVEGFHMTVNGRHETSFAYREVNFCNTIRLHTSLFVCNSVLHNSESY